MSWKNDLKIVKMHMSTTESANKNYHTLPHQVFVHSWNIQRSSFPRRDLDSHEGRMRAGIRGILHLDRLYRVLVNFHLLL